MEFKTRCPECDQEVTVIVDVDCGTDGAVRLLGFLTLELFCATCQIRWAEEWPVDHLRVDEGV